MTPQLTMRHVILPAAMLASSTASCSKATCEETATCGVAPGSDAGADALAPTARCNPEAPFGDKTPVQIANTSSLGSLTLSADELTAFLGANPMYRALRDSVDSPFDAPDKVFDGALPNLAPNGDRLFFMRAGGGDFSTFNIWWATVSGGTIRSPAPLPLNATGAQNAPFASAKSLYFAQSATAFTTHRIWRADWVNNAIGAPTLVDLKMKGEHDEDRPAVTSDDRILYFSFRRVLTDKTLTNPTISRVVLEAGALSTAQNAVGLTNEIDFVSWVSTDDCVVYGVRGETAYRFRRAPL